MYILIVDDNPDIRDILTMNLEMMAMDVRTAENGQVALDIIEKTPPTAILLDLMMPVMDGFTLLGLLNRRGLTQHIPVIVLSAVANTVGGTRLRGARASLQKGRVTTDVIMQALMDVGVQLPA